MRLLTIEDAAKMLAVSKGAARKMLKDVPFIDYGRGRGLGKRWLESDIERFIEGKLAKHTHKKIAQINSKKDKISYANFGPSDFLAMITSAKQ